MILPGTWVSVPLTDRESARQFCRRLVREQVGRADQLARLRRDATQELVTSAADARELGAHTYLMALELLPGVPFPAALLALDESWPESARADLAAGDVSAALVSAFPGTEVAVQRTGPVARRAELVRGTLGEQTYLTLRLEYHVPYPDGSGLMLARVNAPTVPAAEPFATLFDEILDSLTWTDVRV
ncbi:hypothetical protein GCM10025865_05460 [Paraoerskovia sediminicola]|uniref:DUF1795 domain-containing protein n=1 Tax=Paraoerskovia sediminicola TaxID=1138587 RepID=A0ABM8FZJ8_9CELL|nr:hypothetical protein GCM10025865_05460 [Paraoerskovia sediminicola]